MIPKDALCAALLRGLATPEEFEPLSSEPWFDADCADVLCRVSALRELGREVTAVEMAKFWVADGYPIRESIDRVKELFGVHNNPAPLMAAARELHQLAKARRAA